MLIYFAIVGLMVGLTGISISIRMSKKIDQMEEDEWEFIEDHHKEEICRKTAISGICKYSCSECPWRVEEN